MINNSKLPWGPSVQSQKIDPKDLSTDRVIPSRNGPGANTVTNAFDLLQSEGDGPQESDRIGKQLESDFNRIFSKVFEEASSTANTPDQSVPEQSIESIEYTVFSGILTSPSSKEGHQPSNSATELLVQHESRPETEASKPFLIPLEENKDLKNIEQQLLVASELGSKSGTYQNQYGPHTEPLSEGQHSTLSTGPLTNGAPDHPIQTTAFEELQQPPSEDLALVDQSFLIATPEKSPAEFYLANNANNIASTEPGMQEPSMQSLEKLVPADSSLDSILADTKDLFVKATPGLQAASPESDQTILPSNIDTESSVESQRLTQDSFNPTSRLESNRLQLVHQFSSAADLKEKIQEHLQQARKNSLDKIEIKLHPEKLGMINITIVQSINDIQINIKTSSDETATLLSDGLKDFQQAFSNGDGFDRREAKDQNSHRSQNQPAAIVSEQEKVSLTLSSETRGIHIIL